MIHWAYLVSNAGLVGVPDDVCEWTLRPEEVVPIYSELARALNDRRRGTPQFRISVYLVRIVDDEPAAANAPGHFELMEELQAHKAVYDVYLVNPVPLVESELLAAPAPLTVERRAVPGGRMCSVLVAPSGKIVGSCEHHEYAQEKGDR
jgi:hypothetical protein